MTIWVRKELKKNGKKGLGITHRSSRHGAVDFEDDDDVGCFQCGTFATWEWALLAMKKSIHTISRNIVFQFGFESLVGPNYPCRTKK